MDIEGKFIIFILLVFVYRKDNFRRIGFVFNCYKYSVFGNKILYLKIKIDLNMLFFFSNFGLERKIGRSFSF